MRYSPEVKYIQEVHHKMADVISGVSVEKPFKEDEILIQEMEEL